MLTVLAFRFRRVNVVRSAAGQGRGCGCYRSLPDERTSGGGKTQSHDPRSSLSPGNQGQPQPPPTSSPSKSVSAVSTPASLTVSSPRWNRNMSCGCWTPNNKSAYFLCSRQKLCTFDLRGNNSASGSIALFIQSVPFSILIPKKKYVNTTKCIPTNNNYS